jgi:hypothetical protein
MNDLFPQSQETFAEHSANENILRSWSPYNYVGSNPIIRTDPTGMDWYTDKKGNITFNENLTADNADSILQCDEAYYGTTGSEYIADGDYFISYNADGSMLASNPASSISTDGTRVFGNGGDSIVGSGDIKGDRGSGSIDGTSMGGGRFEDCFKLGQAGITLIEVTIGSAIDGISKANKKAASIGTGTKKNEVQPQIEPTVDSKTTTVQRYDYTSTDAFGGNDSMPHAGTPRDTIVEKGKESIVNKLNTRDSVRAVKEARAKNAEYKKKFGY